MLNNSEKLVQQGVVSLSCNHDSNVLTICEPQGEKNQSHTGFESSTIAYYTALGFQEGESFSLRATKVISETQSDTKVFFGKYSKDGLELFFTHIVGKDDENKPIFQITGRISDPISLLRKLGSDGYGIFSYPNHVYNGIRNKHATAFTNLFFEDDNRDLDTQLQRLEISRNLGIDLTIVIFSGGKSYHGYIRLTEDIPSDRWVRLNKMLSIVMDSDIGISTLARAMRLPGVPRIKEGEVREVGIVYQSDNRYSADFIENALLSTGLFPYGLSDQRWQKYQSFVNKSTKEERINNPKVREDAIAILATPESELNPKLFKGNYESTFTNGIGQYIPLVNCISLANRDSLNGVQANRNSTGTALAKDLYGTSEWLSSNGYKTDDPYNLFLGYCEACIQGNGWNQREWESVWKSATRGNPHPAIPESGLKSCVNAYLYKTGQLDDYSYFENNNFQKISKSIKSKSDEPSSSILSFKKWIGKQLKRVKPKGFGVPKIEGEEFEGDRAEVWQYLIDQDCDVLDRSFMGSGKSHAVLNIENPDGKIWYLLNDHRNPTVDGITEDFTDLFPRNQYGFYRNEEGKLVKADESTPKEQIEIGKNCIKADLFPKLTELGYDPNNGGIENPICASCPMLKICKYVPGWYRHDRQEALKSPKIRCHPESLPRDYDYSKDIAIGEEFSQLIKPTKTIKTYWNKLLVEADRYRETLDNSQWHSLDTVLQSIKTLFDNGEKWGLEHQKILEYIDDMDLAELIECLEANPLNLAEIFPVADEIDLTQSERKKHKGAYKTATAHLRNEAHKESKTNLDNLPPNALVYLLKALNGVNGNVLRIKGKTLSITLDNRSDIANILSRFKARIYLDATLDRDRLINYVGENKPIQVIRSKADKPLKNLTISQIKIGGMLSGNYSDTTIKRIMAIQNIYGDMPVIAHKSVQDKLWNDGYWFNHNRGSNDFAGEPNLMMINLPKPNLGAVKDEYLAINGHHDGFEEYYDRLVNDEIFQGVGRQRVNRYPDQEFNLYFITPEHTDLSWLEAYGAKVIVKTGFEINPLAGNQKQITRYRTVETIKQFIQDGIKITQTAIAKALDLTPQAIQKTLREAGINLNTLIEKITGIITTGPYKDSIGSSCNFDWAYKDLNWFFELSLVEVATEIIQIVKSGGMEGLKQYLETYPQAIQGKFLSVLLMLMVDQDFETDSSE
jgi:hypothetical protein